MVIFPAFDAQVIVSRVNGFPKESGIPLGILSIIAGLMLAFLGKRLFRVSLFFAGFYMFALLSYTILSRLEPFNTMTLQGSWNNRNYIYIGVCLISGIMGGILSSCIFKVGVFLIGSLSGFFLSTFILTSVTIQSQALLLSLTICLSVMCGVSALFVVDYAIIMGTSFIGGYLMGFGIDLFANTGITASLDSIIRRRTFPPPLSASSVAVLLGIILVAALGFVVQLKKFKSSKK